jgi:hypothetical protein
VKNKSRTPKPRNLILVPVNILSDNQLYGHPSADPKGSGQSRLADLRRLNNRTYTLIDADTGETITHI